jgi:phosphoribosylanthranilate isomerase
MKDPENIKAVAALSPDYMGFICYGLSPRYIAALLPEVLDNLPSAIAKTGVFVNEAPEQINLLIDKFGFDAIQLHGNESPEFCASFLGKVKVIKAFGLNDDFDFGQLTAYADTVDYLMFDTKTEQHGGSGKVFNWDILDQYKLSVPFFLSGGLSLDNLEKISEIKHPQFYGVDLNSRFEAEPGFKDVERLKKAFNLLKQQVA